jgi:hypothetical protein
MVTFDRLQLDCLQPMRSQCFFDETFPEPTCGVHGVRLEEKEFLGVFGAILAFGCPVSGLVVDELEPGSS